MRKTVTLQKLDHLIKILPDLARAWQFVDSRSSTICIFVNIYMSTYLLELTDAGG